MRQLPPIDTDGDGLSDYVDNAPAIANAARLDMNADGSINAADQLDNDFDTILPDSCHYLTREWDEWPWLGVMVRVWGVWGD